MYLMEQDSHIRDSPIIMATLWRVRESTKLLQSQGYFQYFVLLPYALIMSLLQPYNLIMKSAFLQATDKTFVDKLNSSFKGNLHFQPARGRVLGFSIIHYAGKVGTVCGKNAVIV